MAGETTGFYLRGTSVSELPDGATVSVIGYSAAGVEFDSLTFPVIGGSVDIEVDAARVASWPDTIRVEVVAVTAQGQESRASTPTLVRRS